jgi:VWFA-related protein
MSLMLSRRDFLYLTGGLPLLRGQDTQFSTSVAVVNVLASVRDKNGKIIHDLVQDDFTLQEDGRTQSIRYFSQQSDVPLTLGLLIDTSGSQTRVLDRERNASLEFVEHVLREDKDKTFVIHFDHEVELLQDLTSSRKDLEAALRDLERPQLNRRSPGGGNPQGRGQGRGGFGGGTALYDSLFLAGDEILKKQQGRKAVILLSDGVDMGSKTSLTSAIETSQRADMLVYSIRFADNSERSPVGFGGPGLGRGGRRGGGRFPQPGQGSPGRSNVDGKKILQRISQETGGAYFDVSNKMPLDKIYDQIEEELRNQYNIGYTPDKPGGGYHKVLVSVKRKNLTVRARDGYYS